MPGDGRLDLVGAFVIQSVYYICVVAGVADGGDDGVEILFSAVFEVDGPVFDVIDGAGNSNMSGADMIDGSDVQDGRSLIAATRVNVASVASCPTHHRISTI